MFIYVYIYICCMYIFLLFYRLTCLRGSARPSGLYQTPMRRCHVASEAFTDSAVEASPLLHIIVW